MSRWGGAGCPWRRDGSWLLAAANVHPRWRDTAGVRALHRLSPLSTSSAIILA